MQQAIVGDSAGKKQRDRKLNKEDLSKVYDAQRREEVQGSCSAIDVDDMEEMINPEKRMRSRSEWMSVNGASALFRYLVVRNNG